MISRSLPRLKQASTVLLDRSRDAAVVSHRRYSYNKLALSHSFRTVPSRPSNGVRSLSSQPLDKPTSSAPSQKDKAQEAIEKAEQLHAELNEMIAAQKARKIEEAQRPFGSDFIKFLKQSKPEIINIVFAFVCVLLAYQIHGMRAGIKKLLATQEEKDAEIGNLRGILAALSEIDEKDGDKDIVLEDGHDVAKEASFSLKLSQKCADVVRQIFAESEQRVGYSWILGRKVASGDAMEMERLVDEFQPLILSEIQSYIGDAAYTPEALKERRVASLKQSSVNESAENMESPGNDSDVSNQSVQFGGLVEVLQEVHKNDLPDVGQSNAENAAQFQKTKRTRYAI
mmetsp:Transcript_18530/g.38864  ORF Transcript_18530/g.38864 Transcript_18530/m.38864 type:complete len:342 (-) Transcript_18530:57-1082(-)|eukprot:CAMPEP_0171389962 /NCGR_PEP_ID=MMETSP0880-20121228/341_1 /TAXON_ID=67004 /ORGANISM="Thalassiosira weissflogii, Strain CCMP1336" /LENGTH=341 /DNA_ID=CAMNT_0011902385 /DNA_START=52 /DNA_END=1077 /DNA_ORIENTATION=+